MENYYFATLTFGNGPPQSTGVEVGEQTALDDEFDNTLRHVESLD